MKEIVLMMSMTSAGFCFAGDFVPAQPVAPLQPVLLVMVAHVAAGNNLVDNAQPKTITSAKSKNHIVPKHQKNNHQKFDRKRHRINHPRKDY